MADMELIRDACDAAQSILDDDPGLDRNGPMREFIGQSVEAAHLE
jgi:hypothetical protein